MNHLTEAKHHYEWVDDDHRVNILCEQWQQQDAIALDTEFIRSRTFYPITALLQVADAQGVYLLDPLAINNTEPLKTVFENQNLVKIIHSCSEDLEVFDRFLGVLPQPLFDTQVAAAFAGFGAAIGYANLVKQVHDIDIPKHETRSDWLQRPLTQSQLKYAALDVLHLFSLYRVLLTALEDKGRLSWLEHDCQNVLTSYKNTVKGDQYYRRIKSAWKLNPQQLGVLKALCDWREGLVQNLDIPRNHLIKDTSLISLAKTLPTTVKQLGHDHEIHPGFIKKYGDACVQLIAESLDDTAIHPAPLPPPLLPAEVTLLKQLKHCIRHIADGLQMPPEILAKKKDLEALIRQVQSESKIELPDNLKNWRQDIVGQPLLQTLNKQNG